MKYTFTCIVFCIAQMVWGQGKPVAATEEAQPTETHIKRLEAEIDAIFQEAFPTNGPGATVLIAKGDSILYNKAFGMANLELDVPMKSGQVFQLASITKQFTSVAILMLMEQGKLSLEDPLSKYIPDFPRGNEITLHHLLNHTSGIQSYTNLPGFRAKTRLDMTTEEVISVFKDLPLEFSPNESYAYSNSGYFLLGYIIEQVSGQTYAAFIRQHIFDPLGMKQSYYTSTYQIIPNRASGYHFYDGIYENVEYLSPTIPYSAGALMSTVEDMFRWNTAIHHNTLISEKTKQLAFTNYQLANGKHDNYGYGWHINEIEGISTIEHTGGINGFTTSGIYIPSQNIYAIVLTNLDNGVGPETHNLKAVSAVLGQSIKEKTAREIPEKSLKKWVGAYQFEDVVRYITFEDGALYSTREGGRPLKLEALSEHEFRFENRFATYTFSSHKGKKQVLYSNRIEKRVGLETDKKAPSEREYITLPKEMLTKYVGVYDLQPSFQIQIELQNDRLFALAAGQPAIELFAESESLFTIKEVGAQLLFHIGTDGTVESMTFSQGPAQMEGKKIK